MKTRFEDLVMRNEELRDYLDKSKRADDAEMILNMAVLTVVTVAVAAIIWVSLGG